MPARNPQIALIRRLARAPIPRPRRRIPRIVQPDAIRVDYYKRVRRYLERARELLERRIFPTLRNLVDQAARERADAYRADDARKVNKLLDAVGEEFFRNLARPPDLERDAVETANRTAEHQRRELEKQIGVDVLGNEPGLRAAESSFVAENVALIKSIPSKYFDDVEKTIARAMADGKRWEVVAQLLQDRYGVAESDARRVARDQVGKYFGEVARVRQRALGVTAYVWRTSNDSRVRDEHAVREGQRYEWSDPPEDGHPGHAINCRCFAEPDLSTALGDEPAPAPEQDLQIEEAPESEPIEAPAPVETEAPTEVPGFKVPRGQDLESGIPTHAEAKASDEPLLRAVTLEQLQSAGLFALDSTRGGNVDKILEAWGQGKELPPLKLLVDPQGRIYVDDGRHRLIAAMVSGRSKLLATFDYTSDATGGAVPLTPDLRR
jgi:SPP1 gp7 family putative phage head morphogenesis protein